jgi:hypothetical protein
MWVLALEIQTVRESACVCVCVDEDKLYKMETTYVQSNASDYDENGRLILRLFNDIL